MSMSQEEIEALMNGLDISENENSVSDDEVSSDEKDSGNMSEDDIADLIAQTDLSNTNITNKEETSSEDESIDDISSQIEDNSTTEDMSASDIDDLLNAMNDEENNSVDNEESSISSDELDSIINGIVSENDKVDEKEEVDTSDIDVLIAGLENNKESKSDSLNEEEDFLKDLNFNLDAESIEDMDKVKEVPKEIVSSSSKKAKNVVNVDQINIPNQLGQVANDSEEKATKIFDALSYILDDNEELRKITKSLDGFIQSQHKMLEMLNKKFPNVKEFSDNLATVKELIDKPKEIQSRLHNRDKELFETMELMQFHDINRQKIERVMGLVINLSRQLNAIFDDESNSINIANPNHLPGDDSADLVDGDDLESLIAEFGK